MLTLTYEYKLKPTNREKAIFEDWLEINRKVYNYALSERKAWFKSRSCQINACSLRSEYIFQKVNSRKTSQICPNCQTETGKKTLSERVHACSNCGYTTDRDVAAAQIVCQRGLAAVGYTEKMQGVWVNSLESPKTQESSNMTVEECQTDAIIHVCTVGKGALSDTKYFIWVVSLKLAFELHPFIYINICGFNSNAQNPHCLGTKPN